MKRSALILISVSALWMAVNFVAPQEASAIPVPTIQFGVEDAGEPSTLSTALQIMFLLTILTLAPSILILMTSFSRFVIVLSFLRQAMGTQQTPPTQVLIGLALFLTFFVMAPVAEQANKEGLEPYVAGEIERDELPPGFLQLMVTEFDQDQSESLSSSEFLEIKKLMEEPTPESC